MTQYLDFTEKVPRPW